MRAKDVGKQVVENSTLLLLEFWLKVEVVGDE